MKASLSLLVLLLASSLACRASGVSRAGARVEYEERVTFTFESRPEYCALTIQNLGPGPIVLELEDSGPSATDSMAEGEIVHLPLAFVTRVTVVHAAAGPAALLWSSAEEMDGEVDVQVD